MHTHIHTHMHARIHTYRTPASELLKLKFSEETMTFGENITVEMTATKSEWKPNARIFWLNKQSAEVCMYVCAHMYVYM
jgi:hypothetical protein